MIVHEFPLMCNIIASVLNDEPDIRVVGYVSSVKAVLEQISECEVDLVLISSRLPHQGAIELISLLTQKMPAVKILVLGITESREGVLKYVEAGANGYVLKESSLDDLLTTIRAVHNDRALISPEIAAALIQRISEFAQAFAQVSVTPPDSLNLTAREFEVLELLSQNLSNQEIAGQLVIETGTVKNHVHNILNKLGVDRRESAADLLSIIKERMNSSG